MDGRRELPRWKIEKSVKIKFEDRDDFNDGYIEDMTLTGMCIFLTEKKPLDQAFKVVLELSEECTAHLIVRFPWVRQSHNGYLHGASFGWKTSEDKDRVSYYINKFAKQR